MEEQFIIGPADSNDEDVSNLEKGFSIAISCFMFQFTNMSVLSLHRTSVASNRTQGQSQGGGLQTNDKKNIPGIGCRTNQTLVIPETRRVVTKCFDDYDNDFPHTVSSQTDLFLKY